MISNRTMEVNNSVKRPKWALGFVMMILGLLLTTQFRIQRQVAPDTSRMRAEELAAALSDREEELKTASNRVRELEQQVSKLQESLDTVAPPPQEDTASLKILAGTVEVTGPGLLVTLTETPEAITAKNKVGDEDIWRVVNELLTAGAEAIDVNGQRIASITGVRNVGSRILVNQTMIASPVEIHAVGDPAVLEASLRLRGGVIDFLSRWGITVNITKSDAIHIPPLRKTPVFRYAKPTEEEPS